MQTFLPYDNIEKSIKSLDYKRLGKQRLEAKQILSAVIGNSGWSNHPIVKMWAGYENFLRQYYNFSIKEWVARGYNNSMELEQIEGDVILPTWFGYEKLHASHRANLLRKDPKFYGQYGWKEDPSGFYCWFDTDLRKWYFQERGTTTRIYIEE